MASTTHQHPFMNVDHATESGLANRNI